MALLAAIVAFAFELLVPRLRRMAFLGTAALGGSVTDLATVKAREVLIRLAAAAAQSSLASTFAATF